MESKKAVEGTPVQNITYNMLWSPPQTGFFQLSIVVFFAAGYSFDPNIQPSITPIDGQPTQFSANFSIINNGGTDPFGIVPFPDAQNQFSRDPAQFTLVFITMADTTSPGNTNTSKMHSDDANTLTIL